jgi:signal transduction histidine kinase
MKHPFSTLRARIIILVLLAVVPAWLMILYIVSAQRRSTRTELLGNALSVAQLTAHKEEQLIETTRQLLYAIAHFLSIHQSDPADCSAFLAQFLTDFRRYANLGVVAASGEVLCSAHPMGVHRDTSDLIWFHRVLQTRDFVVGEYQQEGISGRPVLVMAAPVLDHNGSINAVIFAAIDLGWLNEFYVGSGLHLPLDAYLELVDKHGVILAHYPGALEWVGHSVQTPRLREAAQVQQAELIQARGPDGGQYLYAVAPVTSKVRGDTVLVVFGIPWKVAFAQADHAMRINLIWLGIVTLLVVSAAWFGGEIVILRLVNAMVKASQSLAAGDLKARTGLPYGRGELGQLARALDEMAVALEQREKEHRQAEAVIKESREQLRRLSAHAQTVREEERTRIAREIHDDLGQALTALKIDLSWLTRRLPVDSAGLKQKIESMGRVIDASMETVHRLSAELRPGILDDLGLAEAIAWQAEEFQDRTGIVCEVDLQSTGIELTKEQSTAVFRIFQETLTNVARHAHARRVEAVLDVRAGRLLLTVKDDGRGITEEEISRSDSYGILGIRERVLALSGEVTITGDPSRGTTISVRVPIGNEAEDHG